MSKHSKITNQELPELTPQEKSRREIYDWIYCLSVALIICVVIFAFFIRLIDVRGTSMNPTLNNNDKMLVSGLFYEPKVGDVVVFKKDEYDPERALVKRVIAVEGQVINMDFDRGIVYVDGVPLEEDYIMEPTTNKIDFIGPRPCRKAASLSWAITATRPPTAARRRSAWWIPASFSAGPMRWSIRCPR